MITPPVDLDAFKDHIGYDHDDGSEDAKLTQILAAATGAVEGKVGAMVMRASDERAEVRGGVLIIGARPLVNITTLTNRRTGATVDVTTLDVDTDARIATSLTGRLADGVYDVACTIGRDPVPEDLIEATLIVAEQLFETQRGTTATGRGWGGVADEVGAGTAAGAELVLRGFTFPKRALELMANYKTPAVA